MKKWSVTIPIAGSVTFEVETADDASEADAIEAACAKFEEDGADDDTLEWDLLEEICEGNVCHAPVHSAFAEEIKED